MPNRDMRLTVEIESAILSDRRQCARPIKALRSSGRRQRVTEVLIHALCDIIGCRGTAAGPVPIPDEEIAHRYLEWDVNNDP